MELQLWEPLVGIEEWEVGRTMTVWKGMKVGEEGRVPVLWELVEV